MAGKRLRDAAFLLSASRTVAEKHVRIRQHQLDVWTRTSTIGKAVKSQTDRVTLTVQAASVLAQRLNETAQSPGRPTTQSSPTERQSSQPTTTTTVPSQESVESPPELPKVAEGLEQDHHYNKSNQTTAQASLPSQHIDIEQRRSPRDPLPDGTIPPNVASTDTSRLTFSFRDGKDALDDREHDEVPEGVNLDVFQSPGVKRMLGVGSQAEASAQLDQSTTLNARQEVEHKSEDEVVSLASDIAQDATVAQPSDTESLQTTETTPYQMHESRVPASRLGRLWQYGGLATSMAFGAVGEGLRRVTGGGAAGGSVMLSPGNMERLVAKLSRMRGAALKLGQMISFQDLKMLPAPIHEVLQRVQDNADYMPAYQRNSVLAANLGSEWSTLFSSFDEVPLAAASIGQVHKATLARDGRPVAVKIQYPGVATSISSDLNNLSILLTASKLLPKGLFLDKTIANARTELAWECDYKREAAAQMRFKDLLVDEQDVFTVPEVIEDASGPQVLTAELMAGTAVTKASLRLSQSQKDWIGTQILRLSLRELAEFNFMQTDPNWTNFLFNASSQKLELLDFGAARDFPDEFVDPYISLLIAAAEGDREQVRKLSIELGYLTGNESKTMLEAHITSIMTLAEPFSTDNTTSDVFDFRDQTITDRVRSQIPTMVRERLAPPPEETYSLHRKLSGAFLLLARLGSRVKTREMFVEIMGAWKARRVVS